MSSAAAKLLEYSAGKELIALLDSDVRPKDVAERVAALAARLADEARAAAGARGVCVSCSGGSFCSGPFESRAVFDMRLTTLPRIRSQAL